MYRNFSSTLWDDRTRGSFREETPLDRLLLLRNPGGRTFKNVPPPGPPQKGIQQVNQGHPGVAVPAEMVLPVPEGLSMVQAAAIPEAFATAHLNICIEGGLKEGETVLIQAGASGLGMAAIQLVKALGGKVMTTVSTEEKAEFVRGLGADVVLNRTVDDLAEVMDEHPVDVALDCVAGPALGRCIEKMAIGGRWIVIATLAGAITEINMNTFFRRGFKLIGSTLRSRPTEMKAKILSDLERSLWPSFSSGAIKPVIHETLPITRAEEAHAILRRRENVGKVVLTVGSHG